MASNAEAELKASCGPRTAGRLAVYVAHVAMTAGVALVVLAPIAAGTPARIDGKSAAVCSNQTVDGGRDVGKLTLRLVLTGPVSCQAAHRLVRAYFEKVASGQCGQLNNFCVLDLPGGWSCSLFSAVESQSAGGASAGCAQPATGARIRLFKASTKRRQTKTTHPPCTKAALTAALRRGPTPLPGRLVRPWECAGGFAAAGLVAHGNEGTVVFRASGGTWKLVAAEKYCKTHTIPPRIYQLACNSN